MRRRVGLTEKDANLCLRICWHHAARSHVPAAKSIPVRIGRTLIPHGVRYGSLADIESTDMFATETDVRSVPEADIHLESAPDFLTATPGRVRISCKTRRLRALPAQRAPPYQ